MNAPNTDLARAYNTHAGAAFGLWGLLESAGEAGDALRILHMLALRASALSGAWPEGMDWADAQLSALAASAPGGPLVCLPVRRNAWSVWAADALRSNPANLNLQRDAIETSFSGEGPYRDERAAVARLLISVLAQRHALYDPAALPGASADRFSSPDACVCVQIGTALRTLKDEGGPHAALFEEWRGVMLNAVLRRLPARIERGFASRHPLFEDVVLAFLHVANWLERPNMPWIGTYVADCKNRAGECLTLDQLAFGGYLLGFLLGYSKLGAAVQDRPMRAWLSRQALACALQGRPVARASALLVSLTPNGRWMELSRPFARLISLERTESRSYGLTGGDPGRHAAGPAERTIVFESTVVDVDEVLTLRLRHAKTS